MDPRKDDKRTPRKPDEPLAPWPDRRPDSDRPAALGPEDVARFAPYVPLWRVVPRGGVPRLQRTFPCRSFPEAMWLTLKIGELAEAAGQRPTILTDPDHVTVSLRTPEVDGLHREDFNIAFRIDAIYERRTHAAPARRRSDA